LADRADDYRGHAVECLRLAQASEDPHNKALLLEMAQVWVKMAEKARASADNRESAEEE
jgi:hypothetical protein